MGGDLRVAQAVKLVQDESFTAAWRQVANNFEQTGGGLLVLNNGFGEWASVNHAVVGQVGKGRVSPTGAAQGFRSQIAG